MSEESLPNFLVVVGLARTRLSAGDCRVLEGQPRVVFVAVLASQRIYTS